MTGGDNALPFWVPGRFLLTGALALTTAFTALALQPRLLLGSYAAPGALAIVHLLTLGFAATILVGAMHQLMPVLLATQLFSAGLGTWTYRLFLPGAVAVVLGFALGHRVEFLAVGGCLVLAALLLFDYNLWRTAGLAKARDSAAGVMLASAGYLTATAALGLLIALGRALPGLAAALGDATPLHLGLGLFGAFFLAVAGAGHNLLAMFVLAHRESQSRLRLLLWSVHAGLVLLAAHAVTGLPLIPFSVLLLCAAAALFVVDIIAILHGRARRRVGLPLRHFLLAPAFLALALPLVLFGYPAAAIVSLLAGFVTLAICGMFIKVLSFLTWQRRYAVRVGKEKVPLLNDMSLDALSGVSFWSFGLGVPLVVSTQVWPLAGTAATGAMLLALGSWALLAQSIWIVFGRHRLPVTARPSNAPS